MAAEHLFEGSIILLLPKLAASITGISHAAIMSELSLIYAAPIDGTQLQSLLAREGERAALDGCIKLLIEEDKSKRGTNESPLIRLQDSGFRSSEEALNLYPVEKLKINLPRNFISS